MIQLSAIFVILSTGIFLLHHVYVDRAQSIAHYYRLISDKIYHDCYYQGSQWAPSHEHTAELILKECNNIPALVS